MTCNEITIRFTIVQDNTAVQWRIADETVMTYVIATPEINGQSQKYVDSILSINLGW